MKLPFTLAIILIISFVSIIPVSVCGNLNQELNRVIEKIEKENILMGEAVGIAGVRPEQYKNFIALRDMATESELRELTGHTNGVVRAYAFWALILNESNNVFPILIGHLRDNEKIKTMFGCIIDQSSVADFFIQIAKGKLTQSQIDQLTLTLHKIADV